MNYADFSWSYTLPACPYCGKVLRDIQLGMCHTCYSQQIKSTDKRTTRRALAYVLRKFHALGLIIPHHRLRLSFVDKDRLCDLAKVPNNSNLLGLTIPTISQWGCYYRVYLLDKLPLFTHLETLAHELGHVWLQENVKDLDSKSPQEIEGFCELAGYKTLQFDRTIASHNHQDMMLKNQDPIYGHGLRIMKYRAEAMGWEAFLNQLTKGGIGAKTTNQL